MAVSRNSGIYLFMSFFFLLGWLLSLIGLAMVQDWCNDHDVLALRFSSPFNALEVGDSCDEFYGLHWFIWALNTIPIVLACVTVCNPESTRGPMTAFFSALAPLDIFMAHDFYRKADIAEHPIFASSVESKYNTALAGFAMMAGMALLLLLLDSLLVSQTSNAAMHHEGVAADPAKGDAVV